MAPRIGARCEDPVKRMLAGVKPTLQPRAHHAQLDQLDPVEVAHLRLPPRDWNALVCDRCERG